MIEVGDLLIAYELGRKHASSNDNITYLQGVIDWQKNKIVELEGKIAELEGKIADLTEQLSEARTTNTFDRLVPRKSDPLPRHAV